MIWVIIPVHNRWQFTKECLIRLHRQSVSEFRIVVVDDSSTDGSRENLRNEFPNVSVVSGNGNLFWTAAINMGIAFAMNAGATHALTLNNDTEPANDFIEKMLFWSNQFPDAILSSLELDIKTNQPSYGGEVINWFWASSQYLLDTLKHDEKSGLHAVSLASGRGLLVPRKIFETIGLFDEKQLPHYMADFDFTCRAKEKGFDVFCNYDARLYVHSDESGDKEILRRKSFRNYWQHVFGVKGAANLRNFTIFTMRHSPRALIPFHLIKGYSKRLANYFFR